MAQYTFRTPKWSNYSQAHFRSAKRPISARLLRQSEKAFLISTGLRTAWVPKRGVTHDPEKGVFLIPAKVADEKRLD
jgi:hypothetical protein